MFLFNTLNVVKPFAKKLMLLVFIAVISMAAQANDGDLFDALVASDTSYLNSVNIATRKVEVAGVYYSVKLSARVHLPEGRRVGLENLHPPASVRLEVDEQNQVTDIHVLAFY